MSALERFIVRITSPKTEKGNPFDKLGNAEEPGYNDMFRSGALPRRRNSIHNLQHWENGAIRNEGHVVRKRDLPYNMARAMSS